MSTESDVIESLKSKLADLTYILFTIGKELKLIIQKSDDERVKEALTRMVSALQDSNSDVIRLYHAIKSNESGIQNEWYGSEAELNGLQHEVDNLSKSVDMILEGNKNFLDNSLLHRQ